MDINEAATALEGVSRTQGKLAERAKWPLHRHAMFGLSEGLLIAALSQTAQLRTAMIGVGLALVFVCIWDDRRRHGMFVSGWQKGATRPLMIALVLFLVMMVCAGLYVRRGDGMQTIGLIIGLITFTVCTAASVAWERIYRAELLRQDRP